MQSLRDGIVKVQTWYFSKYGVLDWHWYDEGIVWAIQDYYSCKGEFLDDDIMVLKENGFVPEDFTENEDE